MVGDGTPGEIVQVEGDPAITAGDVIEALADGGWVGVPGGGSALELSGPHEPDDVPRVVAWGDDVGSLLTSGHRVRVLAAGFDAEGPRPLVGVTVMSGPDRGLAVGLAAGDHAIGRGAAGVPLSDGSVAERHAVLRVPSARGDLVEIVDSGSATGLMVDGVFAVRAALPGRATIALGHTVLAVERIASSGAAGAGGRTARLTRVLSPVPPWEPPVVELAGLDGPPPRGSLPRVAMLAPALLGLGMFALTGRASALLLVAMSPVLAAGSALDARLAQRRWARRERGRHSVRLSEAERLLAAAHTGERRALEAILPPLAAVADAIVDRGALLWTARPGEDRFLALRVGTGERASRVRVDVRQVDPDVAARAGIDLRARHALDEAASTLGSAPVAIELSTVGVVALIGARARVEGTVRAILLRLVAMHAPSEVAVAAFLSPSVAQGLEWLAWVPHLGTAEAVLTCIPVATDGGADLLAALERLVEGRSSGSQRLPAVVVAVDDRSAADRARLTRLCTAGPAAGVHVLWLASPDARVPAACAAVLRLDARAARLVDSSTGAVSAVLAEDAVAPDTAERLARSLAGVRDDAVADEGSEEPPHAVGLVELHGKGGLTSSAIAARWRLGPVPGAGPATSLRALVGRAARGPVYLDLATDGPHALVGGTTGSGKSEFLQAWVLGMAAAHPPSRVTFLLVDYKGGSAFAECVDLPHCVGLVTDLTPDLVDRALVSMAAEVRRREAVLAAAGAKDLESLLASGRDAPPSLVIVVDEFAALAQEVPAFVDGMVDIAQRGRSLGLHLILATQRPAGVIRERIRANTPLRIALRMADEEDSVDVLGLSDAAHLDRSAPGRALVRTGPGALRRLQAGFAGARSQAAARPPVVVREAGIASWSARPRATPRRSLGAPDGETDARRAVASMARAAEDLGLPPPRRPWCAPLRPEYDLAEVSAAAGQPSIGLVDDPARQRQRALPLRRGGGVLLVLGAPGSGVSTALRSCAVTAVAAPGTPTHVFAIDAAGGALDALGTLAHVAGAVGLDDHEGVSRVLALLAAPAVPEASRRMLLIDGIGPLWAALAHDRSRERAARELQTVLSQASALGVDVVLSATRQAEVPGWVSAVATRTLVLRTAEPAGSVMPATRNTASTRDAPPGRGTIMPEGLAVQVAVPGGTADPASQMRAASAMVSRVCEDPRWVASPVPRLPRLIRGIDLPDPAVDRAVVGVEAATLAPLEIELARPLIVAGGPGSGRSTALAWLAHEARRTHGIDRLVLCTSRPSDLARLSLWDDVCAGPEAGATLVQRWSDSVRIAPGEGRILLVLEGVGDLWPALSDEGAALIRDARRHGHTVIGEEETSRWGAGGAMAELRTSRRGLVLAPEGPEAAQLLGVNVPPVAGDWPPGRGFWVESGRARVVHIPVA